MHIVYMNINRESQKYTKIYNVIVSSYMYKHSNRKLPDQLMHSSELFGVKFLFYNYFVTKSPLIDMQAATVNYYIITKHSVLAYTDIYTVIRILTKSLKLHSFGIYLHEIQNRACQLLFMHIFKLISDWE